MSVEDYASDLRRDEAADQNEAYQQAIRRAIQGWFESIQASGGCDHSVGICMCGEIHEFMNVVHMLIPDNDELVAKYSKYFHYDEPTYEPEQDDYI